MENTEPIINENSQTDNKPSEQNNDNWNFYQNASNVSPASSHGGTNLTKSTKNAFRKKRSKAKTQRNSRRINRNNKKH